MSETETKEYECKKCGSKFMDLATFRGHNLRCQIITKEEVPKEEPEVQSTRSETRDRETSARTERVPLGVIRRKLSFAERAGYKRRWMNDKGSRLPDAQAGGYTFVTQEQGVAGEDGMLKEQGIGSRICKTVGVNDDGSPTKAYLMEIREDWYQADQRKKQEYLDEVEEQLQRGVDSRGRPGQDGRYIPKAGGTQITKGE